MRMLIAMLVTFAQIGVAAVNAAEIPAQNTEEAVTSLQTLLTEALPEHERQLHALAMKTPGISDRKFSYLSQERAIASAMRLNLPLRVSRDNQAIADEVIAEAEAVFDPRLLVSWGYQEFETYGRTVTGSVVLRKYTPIVTQALDIIPTDQPQISAIGFRWQVEEETVVKEIEVSAEQLNGPERERQYSIGIDQQLPWGPSVGLTLLTTDKEVYYNGRGGSYGASWASSLSLNIDTPLPGAQGFGSHAQQDTALKLAREHSAKAVWEVKLAVNTILLEVDTAFWNLVEALESLSVAEQTLAMVAEQARRSERMFEAGRINNYSKALVDAEHARARAEQEAARRNYVIASNALALLTDSEASVFQDYVFLPYGFSDTLSGIMSFRSQEAVAAALVSRPELHLTAADIRIGEINAAFARTEARPNVDLSADYQVAQNGSVYGYKSYFESVGSVMDPDWRTYGYGLRYRYPLLNRAATARINNADTNIKTQQLTQEEKQLLVRQDVYESMAFLHNAEQVMALSMTRLGHARKAYERLNKRRNNGGGVREDELIDSLRRFNEAKLEVVRQKINRKRAESAMLHAQGMMEKRYVQNARRSDFEHIRLTRLAEKGALHWFHP